MLTSKKKKTKQAIYTPEEKETMKTGREAKATHQQDVR